MPCGRIVWWGRDCFWKRYYSNHTNGLIESDNEFLTNVVKVAGRQWQGLALKSDGTVFGFGNNMYGGNNVPAGLSNVVSIAVEGNSCWAFRRDGTVARWGNGNSDQDNANIVSGLSNVTAIAWGGFRNYLVLKKDGTVLGMNFDNRGSPMIDPATGLPTPDQSPVRLVKVQGQVLSNVVALASMGMNPLVLKSDGSVFSLSYQTPGKPPAQPKYTKINETTLEVDLGGESAQIPYRYTSADPVLIDGQALSNVVALASGDSHNLALRRDGTVVAWGNGATLVPAGLSNVTAIAAAEHESLALKRDGTVVAWGANYSGQTSVPVGLSNVVTIASAMDFDLAVTTGSVPSSVFVQPHGRLEEMAAASDLVFKGRVISTHTVTNRAFPDWGKPNATAFKVISILKGNVETNTITFLHITGQPMDWSGSEPPQSYHFEAGQSYLVFAVKADKSDWLYSPPSKGISGPDEFRQLMRGEIAYRTLDARPLAGLPVREAGWVELNLLLNDANPSNQLYAIQKLDSMCKRCQPNEEWFKSDDFKLERVLNVLLPLMAGGNEEIANRAIDCFGAGPDCVARLEPFTGALIKVANSGASPTRRLKAIRALSGTHFEAVYNSLAQLLNHSDENVRAGAIGLLPSYPGNFSEQALRDHAADTSAKVRATVADAIGNGKFQNLLPTLEKLLADPAGRTNPIPPLTLEEVQEGGDTWADNNGDVHTSAGFALLKFDLDQVSNILAANLNDVAFRPNYLCKLAEKNPGPWLTNLVEVLEARRERIWKEVQASGVEPKTNYFESRMALAGTYFQCWNIIYKHLHDLPAGEFSGGKLGRCLDALENAGNTGSQEPTELYELYLLKGLNTRAAAFRSKCEKTFSYDMNPYFNRVASQFTNSSADAAH